MTYAINNPKVGMLVKALYDDQETLKDVFGNRIPFSFFYIRRNMFGIILSINEELLDPLILWSSLKITHGHKFNLEKIK